MSAPLPTTPPPERATNDYDGLLDLRSSSPNNRVRGFPDYAPDEIAEENAFEPSRTPTPPPRSTPSLDLPEEGSLPAMMWPSLADVPYGLREPEMSRRSFRGVPIRLCDVPSFVHRFRRLPKPLQFALLCAVHRTGMGWMDALSKVEETLQWYALVPCQRELFFLVRDMLSRASEILESLQSEAEALSKLFRETLQGVWPLKGTTAMYTQNIEAILGDLREYGTEKAIKPNGEVVEGVLYWFVIVKLCDEQNLSIDLRMIAVKKLRNIRREEKIADLRYDMQRWLSVVGDREDEIEGIFARGDFWHVPKEWETQMDYAEFEYCNVSWEDSQDVDRERLIGHWEG